MIKIKVFTVNPFQENTYLLYDETKECVIIDCGCLTEREKDALKNYIDEHELIPKRLLNTHLHIDHALGNRFIHDEYNLKPEAHSEDEFLVQQMKTQAEMFQIPLVGEPMPLGGYMEEGDKVFFGNSELEVLHVPGHSPGSIAFYVPEEGIVFVGDVIFQGGAIGRTDLPKGNIHELFESIKEKLLTLPDETLVLSGHGCSTTIGNERNRISFNRSYYT